MKLGVFDSGIGGEAIAISLREAFPNAQVITVNDRKNVPYGDKSAQEIIKLTDAALQPLLNSGCNIIVIACNSATAVAIEWLRNQYPTQLFIGLEPMVKTAAQLTKTGIVAICATPATLASERYKKLKQKYAQSITCLELNCHDWATMIEHGHIDEQHIEATVSTALSQKTDVIVLACTHYHWIREVIEKVAEARAVIIDPSVAIIERVRQLTKDS